MSIEGILQLVMQGGAVGLLGLIIIGAPKMLRSFLTDQEATRAQHLRVLETIESSFEKRSEREALAIERLANVVLEIAKSVATCPLKNAK